MATKTSNQNTEGSKETIIEILSFRLGNQEFGIEVDFVEMVIERSEITMIPNSKPFIEGVMNLRGRIVPVLDLTKLLHISGSEDLTFENVLVTKLEDAEVGFLVNEVKEVIRAKESEIDTASKSDQTDRKAKGVVQKGKRLILFLDLVEIMASCERV